MKRLILACLLAFTATAALAAYAYGYILVSNSVAASPIQWPGGVGEFTAVASSWNSATVTLEVLGPDGSTYVAAGTNTTCTANCVGVFYLPAGSLEAVITGAPTGLYASVGKVTQ